MTKSMAILLAGALLAAAGCSSPDGKPGPEKKPGAITKATVEPLAASAARADLPVPLANGSFEEWKDGVPTGWEASQRTDGKWRKVSPKKVPGAKGGTAMQFPLITDDKTAVVLQNLKGKKLLPGVNTCLRALCRAAKGKQIHFMFTYKEDGKEKKHGAKHSGTGEWTEFEKWFTLPAGFDTSSCRILLVCSSNQPGTVEVDDVSLWQAK